MFISPLFTPSHILAKYPPVDLICGDQDPLFDHSLYFAYLLSKQRVNTKLYMIRHFGHGFMSLYLRKNSWMQELNVVLHKINQLIRA